LGLIAEMRSRFVDYHGVYVMDRGMMFTVESDPAAQLAAP
jgi:hypothetical protein